MKRVKPALLLRVGILSMVAASSIALQTRSVLSAEDHPIRSTLRVGFWILWHDREVQLSPAGTASLRTCERCSPIALREGTSVRANTGGGLELRNGKIETHANAVFIHGPVRIVAHGESELLRFPVSIEAREGVLIIAVTLPVEDYVERVVASESGPDDSLESLKALAIVVRSYALHEQHRHCDYDVCDSTHCQLLHWQGVPQRRAASHQAALETAGETLWFRTQRAAAYFTKDCGGQSAAVEGVWLRSAAEPYLAAHADSYCSRTPSQQWTSDLTRTDLASALARRGLAAPGWQHLSVDRRSESGRVITVRVGHTVFPSEDFRIAVGEALGWNRIQSDWFEVSESGEHYHFRGRGSGHGVGLCQKGAAIMGSEGRNATEILDQYFPGAYAADEATGKRWNSLTGSGFILETLDSSDSAFLPELTRARAEASQLSGLNAGSPIVVRAFVSTQGFRDATLSPGWVAAFAEGDWIATQPLRTLAARHLLAETMRHEFLHALVEGQANASSPLWFREGLVELWSADPAQRNALHQSQPSMPLNAVDAMLRNAKSDAQSQAAHHDAAIYAQKSLDQFGRDRVLGWLRSGIPAEVLPRIGQR